MNDKKVIKLAENQSRLDVLKNFWNVGKREGE